MEQGIVVEANDFVSREERARLLRLCTAITHNGEIAEDLVQETLFEAWRHEQQLRNPQLRSQWLSAIARNVALRWLRQRGRDAAHLLDNGVGQDQHQTTLDALANSRADDFDMEIELERSELVELLDRALALLPAEVRTILIQRYVDDHPLSEIAAQCGASVGAIAMRLQRGKVALRHVLTTTMQHEIASYAPPRPDADAWETTPIWCFHCGQQRMQGKRWPADGALILMCPNCHQVSTGRLSALQGVNGFKPLFTRLATWCNDYYTTGLDSGSNQCVVCGHTQPFRICTIADLPTWVVAHIGASGKAHSPNRLLQIQERVVSTHCFACRSACTASPGELALALPQGRAFMQRHPHICALPTQQVEAEGRDAFVTRFTSLTDRATFAVVFDAATYQVLHSTVETSQ